MFLYENIKLFLSLLYRIFIISSTLTLLNNESMYHKKFLFTVISTSIVFFMAQKINESLRNYYTSVKKKIGIDLSILVGPLIISILYIFRHSCANYLCIHK